MKTNFKKATKNQSLPLIHDEEEVQANLHCIHSGSREM